MTATEVQVIIERLETQMGSTAGTERFKDREVVWSSAKELSEKLAYFRSLLETADGTTVTPRPRFIRMSTDSGY